MFFELRVYFETSFELPKNVTKELLQVAIDKSVSSRFGVFLSTINEKNKRAVIDDKKKHISLESIEGSTINKIHESIISICEDDHENAFRIFFATDSSEQNYLVIHAHHGVADGFLITAFGCSIYSRLNTGEDNETLIFTLDDALSRGENIKYPSSWNVSSPEEINTSIISCVNSVTPATIFAAVIPSDSHDFINMERIVAADVTRRALSTANYYRTISHGSCIHGMLLQCYLRGMIMSESLMENGSMNINTIVNMRRYIDTSVTTHSPSLCVGSFPISVSVDGILSHEENCGSIQSRVTQQLENGLPLALDLNGRTSHTENSVKDRGEIFMELSNLGLHPEKCLSRRLITQKIYSDKDINTVSVVVWMDLEGRLHFCGSSVSSYFAKERLTKFMNGLVHEVFELGVIWIVCL